MQEHNMSIVKSLISVAWADGKFEDAEREMVEALISAFEASEAQAKELRAYASEKKTLDDLPVDELSDDDARVLLQHSVLLSFVDGTQAESERKMIDEMAKVLRIPDDEAKSLIDLAETRAKRFLNLL